MQNKELLLWMHELVRLRIPGTHLIVTSRQEQDIESRIKRWACTGEIVTIKKDQVDNDIRSYVEAKVGDHDSGLKRWHSRPEVQSEIVTELMKKAQGM